MKAFFYIRNVLFQTQIHDTNLKQYFFYVKPVLIWVLKVIAYWYRKSITNQFWYSVIEWFEKRH